jgi:hypothetical protein
MAITNKNCIHDEFEIILNLVNAYYSLSGEPIWSLSHDVLLNDVLKTLPLTKNIPTVEAICIFHTMVCYQQTN